MDALHRDFDASTSDLFDQLADPCVVTRGTDAPANVRAIVEDGVEQVGEYGRVIGNVTRISFIKAEWDPARGDLVSINDTVRKIEAIDTDDGLVAQAVLHG